MSWRGRASARTSSAVRETAGQAGQPTPRARLTLAPALAPRRDEILASLRADPPRIELLPAGDDGFYLAPETLVPGEESRRDAAAGRGARGTIGRYETKRAAVREAQRSRRSNHHVAAPSTSAIHTTDHAMNAIGGGSVA